MNRLIPFLAVLVFIPSFVYAQTPETITIDLSGTSNSNDFPYGIECDADPNFCFISIHAQGILAKIDKTDKSVTLIADALESASSGKDFYAITTDGNGNLYIPERDNGEVKKYNIGTDTWTRIVVMEQVVHPDVSYPNGYTVNPNLIRVDEPIHGFHTYQFSSNSFGGIEFTNGFVWQGLNYNLDFDSNAESIGVTDVSFSGLVRIDPSTNAVTRISIPGAIDIRGVDADGSILWITDQSSDKIFKFDTNSLTVVDSIVLSAGSNPRGLSHDSTYLYVALNKPCSGSCGNSEILRVDKSNLNSQTVIDTTAENTNGGTFTTFVFGDFLIWTDQSNHIGVITISTQAKSVFPTVDANSNHFVDMVGSEIWVAGQGSAIVSTLDTSDIISSPSKKGGSGSEHLTKPTFGVSHITNKQFVYGGYSFNGVDHTINDNFHTNTEKQEVKIGQQNIVSAKVFAPHKVKVMEFDFGVPRLGEFHNAEVKVEFWFDQQQNLIDTKVFQKENLVSDVELISAGQASCSLSEALGSCFEVVASFVFLEQPFNDILAVHAIDYKLRDQVTYLNDGIDVTGESLNPPDTAMYGFIKMTQIDKFENLWVDENDVLYTTNSFGTWIRLSPIEMPVIIDSWKVDERHASYWPEKLYYEELRAKLIFDSSTITKAIPTFIPNPELVERQVQ